MAVGRPAGFMAEGPAGMGMRRPGPAARGDHGGHKSAPHPQPHIGLLSLRCGRGRDPGLHAKMFNGRQEARVEHAQRETDTHTHAHTHTHTHTHIHRNIHTHTFSNFLSSAWEQTVLLSAPSKKLLKLLRLFLALWCRSSEATTHSGFRINTVIQWTCLVRP